MQICTEATKDIAKGNVHINMVNNLFDKSQIEVLYRLDVNFNIEESNFDALVGRTAHIIFLENEDLLKMITARYKIFFS